MPLKSKNWVSLSPHPAILAEGLVGTLGSTNIDKDLKLFWIVLVIWALPPLPSAPCLTLLIGNLEKKKMSLPVRFNKTEDVKEKIERKELQGVCVCVNMYLNYGNKRGIHKR